MDYGMSRRIAWAGALLSQQRHSLRSSALYSSLQNILTHKTLFWNVLQRKNN